MDLGALIAKVSAAAPEAPCATVPPCAWLTAHMDGDFAAYYCSGNQDTSPGLARKSLLDRVDKVKMLTGASSVIMHMTAPCSTKGDRFIVAKSKPYQGGRKGSKPTNWAFLRDFIMEHNGSRFSVKSWDTREADDGIAYLTHTLAEKKGQLHVVHTADKDLRQFAGIHLSWRDFYKTTVPLGAYEVWGEDGKLYGHKWFWNQMLTGDPVDNIPGLPGVGEVAAGKILRGTACNEQASGVVCEAYRTKVGKGWESFLVEQAMLLWMRVDRAASILDFLRLGCFPPSVQEAAMNASKLVEQRVNYLNGLKL